MTETIAQVFAAYLGLDPQRDTWCYDWWQCGKCSGYDPANTPDDCECGGSGIEFALTATSPLAPEPTPGWTSVLLRHTAFADIRKRDDCDEYSAGARHSQEPWNSVEADALTPEAAMCRALVAADPALRARLEACGDYSAVRVTVTPC